MPTTEFAKITKYSELRELYAQLNTKIHELRQKLDQPDADARHVGLRGMQEVIAGYYFAFSSIIHERSQEEIAKSFGEHNQSIDDARRMVEDAFRLGMLALLHFRLDSLLQNILRAFNAYDKKIRQYSTMVDRILELSKPAKADEVKNTFLLMGHLRNSLHNNGIHRAEPFKCKIADMSFVLEKEKSVQCAGWSYLFALCFALVDALDSVLGTKAIKELPAPIVDQYAAELEAG